MPKAKKQPVEPADAIMVAVKIKVDRQTVEKILIDFLLAEDGELPNSRQKLINAIRDHYEGAVLAQILEDTTAADHEELKPLAEKFGRKFLPELYLAPSTH